MIRNADLIRRYLERKSSQLSDEQLKRIKQLESLLDQEISEEDSSTLSAGPVIAYALGKRAEEVRLGKDPKEIRPTNRDALEFYMLCEKGTKFYGMSPAIFSNRILSRGLGINKKTLIRKMADRIYCLISILTYSY